MRSMTNGTPQPAPTAPIEATSSPIDVGNLDAVRQFLTEMLAQGRDDEVIEHVINLLLQLLADNTAKTERIASLLKALYGRSSEKISAAQLELFLKQAAAEAGETPTVPEADEADDEVQAPEPTPEPRQQRRPGRNALPAHLPRERIELKVPDEQRKCLECGLDKVCIGHETSEVLNFRPASLYVEEFWREKLACKPCQDGVVIAPAAEKVIAGGMAGAGLLAFIAVSKYVDHLPLYRLVQILSRWGVEMSESTLGSWIAAVARLLGPVAGAIAAKALACRMLGADDTGMKVLDNDDERGIKRGHIWMYLGYEAGVPTWPAFAYTPDWKKAGPAAFLEGRTTGILQCDGYKGWISLANNELAGMILAGCWAHYVEQRQMRSSEPNICDYAELAPWIAA